MKDYVKDYLETNRFVLIGYFVFLLIFYGLNIGVYRHSIDAPVDIIFIAIFIVVSPAIMNFITQLRMELKVTSNRQFVYSIVVHMLVPMVLHLVLYIPYILMFSNSTYFLQTLSIYGLSIPGILFVYCIVSEYKVPTDGLFYRMLILIGYGISFLILYLIFYNEWGYLIAYVISFIYLYILPLVAVLLWYRKKALIL
jgi:hypothetical protein